MVTHSSILAQRISWTEEPGGLQSTGLQSRTRLSNFTHSIHILLLEEQLIYNITLVSGVQHSNSKLLRIILPFNIIKYQLCFPVLYNISSLLTYFNPISLCWEDPLEKGMVTHSSILAQRIPWTEEPGKLPSMESQRIRWD